MRCRLGLALLLWVTLVYGAEPSVVDRLVQTQPRQAYDLSVAELNNLKEQHRDAPRWHAIASDSAYSLALNREALSHANAGLQLLGATTNTDLRFRLQIARAQALDIGGEGEQALKLLNALLLELEAQENPPRLLEAIIARGVVYTTLARTSEALVDLRRAYTLAPVQSDRTERADVAAAIGNLYATIKQNEDAARFYEEAITRHRETGNQFKLAVETYSLALTRLHQKQFNVAQQLMRESKLYSEKIDDRQGVAFARFGLAEIAREQGLVRDGYQDYQYAIKWFRQAGDKSSLILSLRGLALAKMESGQNSAALLDINEALALAQSQSDQSITMRTHETYAHLLAQMGDYKKAYEQQLLFHQKYDALMNENMSITTAELRVKFDADKRQQENELLQKENALKEAQLQQQQQRSGVYFLSLTLAILVVAFLAYAIYKQKITRKELSRLAATDVLTGLYNRRRLLDLAQIEFERSHRYGVEFCAAILDLDHFKRINDHYGHDGGDKVLKSFAQLCRQSLRSTDVIGRWGGEEFVVILAHTNLATAISTLDRLRQTLTQLRIEHNGETIHITVSIGVAQLQGDADFNVLLNRADHALYGAKNDGRNRVKGAVIVRDVSGADAQQTAHNFEML